MQTKRQQLKDRITFEFQAKKSQVKRPAKGALKYDYLVPAGYYQEQWDWDAFFMGVALSSELASEAIYLKNWARNYIIMAGKDGKVPGCVTPDGADPRLNHMKPFMGQGVYVACIKLGEWDWVEPLWSKIKLIVSYRERYLWSKEYDLGMWFNSFESGADDNVASLDYPDKTVVSADVNAFLYREYLCLSKVATRLGKQDEAETLLEKAKSIRRNVNKHLWNKEDQIYWNLDTVSGEHIRRISYSSFVPLWAAMAPQAQGEASIRRYVLDKKHLWTPYGIRTLSKQDPQYNNVNRIKPHSNWQGPVWPIANWIYMHALLNYGLQEEAIQVAENITRLVLADIDTTGGMHENYDAETGAPLAADNFVSWNLLVGNMIDEAEQKRNPLAM
jgi:alpha,alpha-trehalase